VMPDVPVEMYSTGSTSVLIPDSSLNEATWIPSTWITKVDAVMTVGLPPATGATVSLLLVCVPVRAAPERGFWRGADQPSP
jgi:hypothetical protein